MFDTTFILPYCRIEVRIDSINDYLILLREHFLAQDKKIALSTCSFLEAKWKAISLQKKGNIQGLLESTNLAIDSLTKNDLYEIIPSESNSSIHSLADSLMNLGHSDYMDCLIFATAKFFGLKIITLDYEIQKLIAKSKIWNNLQILSWRNFITEINLKI